MTDDQADIGAYRGVGGWLLFLCLKLTVLLPLGMLYALAILASTIASLPKDTVIISAVIANIVIGLGIVALSIYAGISLWSIRPGAVRLAKAYLIAHLMYTIALAFECIIAMPLLLSSATGSSSPDVGGQLFFQLSMSLIAIQIAVSGVAHFIILYRGGNSDQKAQTLGVHLPAHCARAVALQLPGDHTGDRHFHLLVAPGCQGLFSSW